MDFSEKVEALREAQRPFSSHRGNRPNAISWWYLEGMIDVHVGNDEWVKWAQYKRNEQDSYEAYMQGRKDAEGDLSD